MLRLYFVLQMQDEIIFVIRFLNTTVIQMIHLDTFYSGISMCRVHKMHKKCTSYQQINSSRLAFTVVHFRVDLKANLHCLVDWHISTGSRVCKPLLI